MFQRLDSFGLHMFEQPLGFDDLSDHALLARQVDTPVCLDESMTSLERARRAVELKSCRWVNIKPGRVGGLTTAVQIHDFFQSASIPCWVGGMLESAVGGRHCAALATLENFRYPADLFPSSKFYRQDLAEPHFAFSRPWEFDLDGVAGVGAAPHPKRLAHHTVQKVDIRPLG